MKDTRPRPRGRAGAPWRRRLAQDGVLLGKLTRIFVETMHRFYAARAARDGAPGAKTGSVTALQRTSSDLRLNPHLHVVVLDGAWYEEGGELCWAGLGHLETSEVGGVLESTVRRFERHLRRSGLLRLGEYDAELRASSAVPVMSPGFPGDFSALRGAASAPRGCSGP